MGESVKKLYKTLLGNNGFGIHNKSSPIEQAEFPNGDIVVRYDLSSSGLPPNWETVVFGKVISNEELKKHYPMAVHWFYSSII